MTILLDDTIIRLQGPCRVEEAETLTSLLQERLGVSVDVSACEDMHGAVLQVVLAFRPPIVGLPADPFIRNYLLPALAASRPAGEDRSGSVELSGEPVQGLKE